MDKVSMFEELRIAVLDGDDELALNLSKEYVEKGISAQEIIDEALSKGIKEAGELFENGDYFLPDIVCSADAMKASLEYLEPLLLASGEVQESKGKVILATVAGDVHDIGKTIVNAMLTSAGFSILDLGADVSSDIIVKEAIEQGADIVGLSAMLTTTMEEQKAVINQLKDVGFKGKVIIGGAPVNQNYADSIQADGYSEDAVNAVKLALRLMEIA